MHIKEPSVSLITVATIVTAFAKKKSFSGETKKLLARVLRRTKLGVKGGADK